MRVELAGASGWGNGEKMKRYKLSVARWAHSEGLIYSRNGEGCVNLWLSLHNMCVYQIITFFTLIIFNLIYQLNILKFIKLKIGWWKGKLNAYNEPVSFCRPSQLNTHNNSHRKLHLNDSCKIKKLQINIKREQAF